MCSNREDGSHDIEGHDVAGSEPIIPSTVWVALGKLANGPSVDVKGDILDSNMMGEWQNHYKRIDRIRI